MLVKIAQTCIYTARPILESTVPMVADESRGLTRGLGSVDVGTSGKSSNVANGSAKLCISTGLEWPGDAAKVEGRRR